MMENGSLTKINGHAGQSFKTGPDRIKMLSNSKMSLQSLRSNASSVSNRRSHLNNNGYSSNLSLAEFEIKEIFIELDAVNRKYGFSVLGGKEEGFPPRIDEIKEGSPAECSGLYLDDEIIEVNGMNVEQHAHAEIIMHIYKCKQNVRLKVRRYPSSSNGHNTLEPVNIKYHSDTINERPIDVPSAIYPGTPKTNGEVSPQTSVDGMLKFKRTQPRAVDDRHSNIPSRFVNEAFMRDEYDEEASIEQTDVAPNNQPKTFALSKFVALLDVMKQRQTNQPDVHFLQELLNSKNFQAGIKMHNRMSKIASSKKDMETMKPVATNSLFLLSEVRHSFTGSTDPTCAELLDIITNPNFVSLLTSHDHIAMRESLDSFPELESSGSEYEGGEEEDEADYINEEDQRVKIVRIDKTIDPLGATVRNEGDAVIISRIVKGGAAEKSGLLHEGDEILEINNQSVKGKDINEVVELLSELEGTLTFVLLPSILPRKQTAKDDDSLVLKALFDYEPTEDEYIPCAELGLHFRKGDLLAVINQTDPNWWQARLLNTEEQRLAGLIPSKHFQLQREKARITLKGEDKEPILQEKKRCFCGRARRKGKKEPSKSLMPPMEAEVLTYEDMTRMAPDPSRRRPVVLVGAPQVGRRELRERLISEYPDKYAAAVPHTTRVPSHGEISGVDYTFVTKATFEKAISSAEFIEHGQYDGHYYGTSFSAVRSIIRSGKTCVLNMNCQTLPILKSCNLLPYILFVTLPPIGQLNRLRELDDTLEPFNPTIRLKDDELKGIIEKARDMHRTHGHFFDRTIINSDFETAYNDLLDICNELESQPQYVPSTWVR